MNARLLPRLLIVLLLGALPPWMIAGCSTLPGQNTERQHGAGERGTLGAPGRNTAAPALGTPGPRDTRALDRRGNGGQPATGIGEHDIAPPATPPPAAAPQPPPATTAPASERFRFEELD